MSHRGDPNTDWILDVIKDLVLAFRYANGIAMFQRECRPLDKHTKIFLGKMI